MIPAAVSILANLLQYNPDVRQHLAADLNVIIMLIRCKLELSTIHLYKSGYDC